MCRYIAISLLLTLILLPRSYAVESPEAPAFHVIVNAKNPVDSLERRFIADIFFKRLKRWPEDGLILPADLAPASEARQAFSDEVLGRSVPAMKNYWEQLIFSGQDVPPPEFQNDEEVMEYIANNPSSIGYVSGDSTANDADRGIKRVSIK